MVKQNEAIRLAFELEYHRAYEAAAELRRLHALNQELLAALRQLRIWLPIMTKIADLDTDGTMIEFSEFADDPSRPPETISIASSLEKASTAIAKATGEHQ